MSSSCVFWLAAFIVLCCGSPIRAAAPTAADFLPIEAGGAAEVEKPAAVKVDEENDRVEAASGQDAANAATAETTKSLASSPASSAACFMSFPSGCGVLATGKATYRVVPNAELSRIAQRRAFVQAFMWAKKEMAQFLDGLSNEARDEISKTVSRLIEAENDSATNRITEEVSVLRQDVSKLLKGFVVYEINDEQKDGLGTVYVSIAASPATCLKTGRKATGFVSEATLAEGIERMLLEIRQGVVAPVGGRIIEVPGTGETAFVGFGAAVVGESKDPETRAELLAEAERSAKMYAGDALCGILRGDLAAWTGSIVEKHRNSFKEFVDAQQGDPLNAEEDGSMQRLSEAVSSMVNTRVNNDILTSARSGRVPGGVPIKTWMDDDKHWAYAVAIYFPSASNKARDVGKMMDESNLVPDAKGGAVLPSQRGPGAVPGEETGGKQPLPTVKPVPGGRVGGQKL
jgi:hypothetical protein